MSFGPTHNATQARDANTNASQQATTNSAAQINAGTDMLNRGNENTTSGTNFLNTILNGNQANTAAMLQPNINQIREGDQNAIQTASTLMPRGGGRSSTLFQMPFRANAQISNLFNGTRAAAAGGLAQIGQGQSGQGAGLFGIGNNALNTATGANAANMNYGLQQQGLTQNYVGMGLKTLFG